MKMSWEYHDDYLFVLELLPKSKAKTSNREKEGGSLTDHYYKVEYIASAFKGLLVSQGRFLKSPFHSESILPRD